MKNKVLIALIVLVVAVLSVSFYYLRQGKSPAGNIIQGIPETTGDGNNQTNEEQVQNKLVTDDFEINIPEGWIQTAPAMGASAMAINNNEQSSDPAVQKINFKSYLAVSYDTLQGKSLSEYMQTVKIGLQELVSEVSFAEEHDAVINDRPARAIEADMTQQGVDFKVLMVAIKGEGDDVWTISFNTAKNDWNKYKEIFSSVANSFSLKK